MKQFKKLFVVMMCMCVMLGCVACANDNADDNGAMQNDTVNDANDNTDANDTGAGDTENIKNDDMNDATDGTNTNKDGEGVMDEIGDDIGNGVNDIVDDMDGDNRQDEKNTDNR